MGGSHFLSRLPGAEGMYLSLTGVRLKGEDVKKAGVASHYITHQDGLVSIYIYMNHPIMSHDANEINKIIY